MVDTSMYNYPLNKTFFIVITVLITLKSSLIKRLEKLQLNYFFNL